MTSIGSYLQMENSPFTLEYAVKGGRHTVTVTARGELPDELHLRLSDEAFAADRTVKPAAASHSGCEPVGLQQTLKFSEIPFDVVDGVHTATLTVRLKDLLTDVSGGSMRRSCGCSFGRSQAANPSTVVICLLPGRCLQASSLRAL